jgi:tetratricopeptide (TPR) repeat protein
MELSEEKELREIKAQFNKGVDFVRKRQYQDALPVFEAVTKEFGESQFYSVTEIESRCKVYKKVCEAKLIPVELTLESDLDFLYNGIYLLNAGDLDKALERFEQLKQRNYEDPYLDYMFALLYLKKEDTESCLSHLKIAIEKDEFYRVIAHNEPDFDPLFENQDFTTLIDTQNETEYSDSDDEL